MFARRLSITVNHLIRLFFKNRLSTTLKNVYAAGTSYLNLFMKFRSELKTLMWLEVDLSNERL